MRICVASRLGPEADIKAILDPLGFHSVSLYDEHGQKEDIKNYIESVVNTNSNMRDWSPEHKQIVIDTLTEKADGMAPVRHSYFISSRYSLHSCRRFQCVQCELNYLARCHPRRIQEALNELPDTLDGTYERTLRAINNTNWETARQLLQCVTVASHPLRVGEVADLSHLTSRPDRFRNIAKIGA